MLDLNNPIIEFAIICPECRLDKWHCRGFNCDECGKFTHKWHRVGDLCLCDPCVRLRYLED